MTSIRIKFCRKQPISDFTVMFPSDEEGTDKKVREPDAQRIDSAKRLDEAFSRLISSFVSVSEAHLYIVPFVMASLLALQAAAVNKDLFEALDKNGKKTSLDDADEVEYEIAYEDFGKIANVLDQIERTHYASEAYARSLIIQLSTSFDIIVAGIIEQIVLFKPSVLEASERRVDFIDVDKYDNIQDLKNSFVEKAVDAVVQKSRSDQFGWMIEKLGIPLTKNLDGWSDFIEINERRNLFTHTEGRVTKEYLDNCVKAGCKRESLGVLGEKLEATPKYVRRASELSFVIGLKLLQVVWRKISEEYCGAFLEEADRALITTTYELNRTKKQRIASQLGSFACGEVVKRYASDTTKRMLHINYAASLMLQDKCKEAINVLDRLPWDAVGPEFALSVAAVKNDIDECCKLMRKAVMSESLSKRDLQEWPVFFKVRKTDAFKAAFEALFREKYIELESNKQIGPEKIAEVSTQMQNLTKHFDFPSKGPVKKSVH